MDQRISGWLHNNDVNTITAFANTTSRMQNKRPTSMANVAPEIKPRYVRKARTFYLHFGSRCKKHQSYM